MKTNQCVDSLLVILVMFLFFLHVDISLAKVIPYCRDQADNYAATYCNKVCSDGYWFDNNKIARWKSPGAPLPAEGNDCCHFVSSCMGSPPNSQYGGQAPMPCDYCGSVYGLTGVNKLAKWLIDEGRARVVSRSQLKPGDVILFDLTTYPGEYNHSAIYRGYGQGVFWVSWHSAGSPSICSRNYLSLPNVKKYYYLQINVATDVYPGGDACGDSVADVLDLMTIIDYLLGRITLNDCQLARADLPSGNPPYNCIPPNVISWSRGSHKRY